MGQFAGRVNTSCLNVDIALFNHSGDGEELDRLNLTKILKQIMEIIYINS